MKDTLQKYIAISKRIIAGANNYLGDNKEAKLVTFIATFITLLLVVTGLRQIVFVTLTALASMYFFNFLLNKYSKDEQ